MLFKGNSKRGNGKSASKTKGARPETPFESRRRALAEQEAALKAQAEKHQRFIEVAPQIAAERQRQQREMFLRNAAQTDRTAPRGAVQLPDSRYLYNEATVAPPRSRRRDREKGKWMFFFLILALLAAICWAWQTLAHPAF